MVTIEASNIYFRGGLVLLEQVLDYCEENAIKARVFIGYQEVYDYLLDKGYNSIFLEKTTNFKTFLQYFKKRSNTLFFCNLPPFVKCKQSVLYAHNILFFESPFPEKGQGLLFNLKKFLYYFWIKFFSEKVDVVACQTNSVKDSLANNLNIKAELYPFYRSANLFKVEKTYEFCYIGSGAPHKNNLRLLEAVDRLSEYYHFKLVMTIENNGNYEELIRRIDGINNKYNRNIVVNLGLLPYKEVSKVYAASKALIFPSQAETIALPLIEGLQYGLKILSSDLDFTYQVVDNPIVFNPEREEDIQRVMESFLNGDYDEIFQRNKIPNRLPELMGLLHS